MKQIYDAIIQKLDGNLATLEQEENSLKRISKECLLIDGAIAELNRAITNNPELLADESIRAEYNRNYFPTLYAKRLLYGKCYELENQRLHSRKLRFHYFCARELQQLQQFFSTHQHFCQHFYGGNGESDALLTASLLANELYGALLRKELQDPTNVLAIGGKVVKVSHNGKLIDIVELAMAEWLCQETLVDGKPATQEFIKQQYEKKYGVVIENWDSRVQDLKRRQNEPLKKHLERIRKLSHYLDILPEDKSRKKTA